jgi:hypothetical protein
MIAIVTLVVPWPAFADTLPVTGATMRSVTSACPDGAVPGVPSIGRCSTIPPTLSLPGSISVEATSSSGATVSYSVYASDANSISPTVSCAPSSGSTFRIGVTVVTCSAVGASGLAAVGSFTVQVQDTRPPAITRPPDITLEATGAPGAQVVYPAPVATDVGGPAGLTVACTPSSGSNFPLGTSVVTCSATDAAGNPASTHFNVTVADPSPQDSEPPAE